MRKNNHEPFDVKSDLRMWKSASSEPPIPNQVAKGLRDANQLAKLIVDSATGEAEDSVVESKRKPPSKRRVGGLKGGKPYKKRVA